MFYGSIVALVTPFLEDGKIDLETLQKLVIWYGKCGTNGIVLCGTTGEGWSLSRDEKREIMRSAKEVSKIPLIMNAGTESTAESVEIAEEARAAGMDGLLAIVPYYNLPTYDGCRKHFEKIVDVGVPTILYHHPKRTGVSFTAQELADFEGIAGYKLAATPVRVAAELVNQTDVPVLSGDDALTSQMMMWGAKGAISVVANLFPKEVVAGDDEVKLVVDALSEVGNPSGVKFLMGEMGLCRSDLRLPLVLPEEKMQQSLLRSIHGLQKVATLLD